MIYETGWKTRDGKYRQIWLYGVWASMKQRCLNPNASNYHRYGGRGIRVCNIWRRDFPSFRKWAIDNGYRKGLQIDRIDNNGNYQPNNCRWSTAKEQRANQRTTPAMRVSRNVGTDNPASKVTPEQAAKIIADRRPQTAIAKDYGISQQTVSRVKNSDYWKSDWRVAGAILDSEPYCHIEEIGDGYWAVWLRRGGVAQGHDKSLPRAIIEAFVGADS
jgi:hypothetical protein